MRGAATDTLIFAGGTLQATGTFNLGTNGGPIIGTGDGTIEVTGTNETAAIATAVSGGILNISTTPCGSTPP